MIHGTRTVTDTQRRIPIIAKQGDYPELDWRGSRWHRILRQAGALVFIFALYESVAFASAVEAAIYRLVDPKEARIASGTAPIFVADNSKHAESGRSRPDLLQLGSGHLLMAGNGDLRFTAGRYNELFVNGLGRSIEIVAFDKERDPGCNDNGICGADIRREYLRGRNIENAVYGWILNIANSDSRSMSGSELVARELQRISSQSRLFSGGSPQGKGEAGNRDGSDGRQRAVVFVNERALAYEKERDMGTTRNRLMQLGLFVLAVVAFVVGCALLVRR